MAQPTVGGSGASVAKSRNVVVLLVVLVVILAAVGTIFLFQSLDYRGSKYRAQRTLMFDMSNVLTSTGLSISHMLDTGYNQDMRAYGALEAAFNSDRLDWLCQAIASMYRSGDDIHSVFENLGIAFDRLQIDVFSAYEDILQADHAIESGLNITLTAVGGLVWDLSSQFQNAIPKIPGFGTPSSPPVRTLDLQKIGDDASALLALV